MDKRCKPGGGTFASDVRNLQMGVMCVCGGRDDHKNNNPNGFILSLYKEGYIHIAYMACVDGCVLGVREWR